MLNLITDVVTTPATVPDVSETAAIQQRLAERGVKPGEHYLDAGYPSAALIVAAAAEGITMVTPAGFDRSPQARAAEGFAKDAFTVDWMARQVRCPAGKTSATWTPVRQRGADAIVVKFAVSTCRDCPFVDQCTTARPRRRSLTLYPKALHRELARARARQQNPTWRQKYALRSGIEGTINQALDVTGLRRARYRGLAKVRLQHAFSAAAINLIRLDAHWNNTPLPRPRTSNLQRLNYQLAA